MAKNEWESIDQVPLLAWYRFKARPNNVYRISEIDLQYCGGAMMPGLAIKAGPAVMIDHQWWRPNELSAVFDVSCDGTEWQSCAGEVGGRGNLTDRVARLEAALVSNNRQISEYVAQVLQERIELLQKLPAGNSEQAKEAPKSNPGAKPPEPKK